MNVKYKSVFATRLRELIKERGITITALAKELKISRQAVSQYINGSAYPNIERLFMIARFFDVSADTSKQKAFPKIKKDSRRI